MKPWQALAFALVLAALSMAGMPPLVGFLTKEAAFESIVNLVVGDIQAITELESLTRLRVQVRGAAEDDIHGKINEAYGERKTIEEVIEAGEKIEPGDWMPAPTSACSSIRW